MKKASILSFQFADNYGAVLQIYAMSKILENKGFSVEVIDFNPEKLAKPYKAGLDLSMFKESENIKSSIRTILIKLFTLRRNLRRNKNFEDFRNNYLNLTDDRFYTSQDLDKAESLKLYDVYIVGSDQVWNPAFFEAANDAYFLNFANESSLKIAYAASIAEEISEESFDIFEKNLKNFNAISVRESSAKDEIQPITDKDIMVTLDPTLLMKQDFWKTIIPAAPLPKPFILVYDLVKDERIIKVANSIAKELNCKIISYSYHKGYENWHSTFAGCHPTEFLRLYRDAEFVVTSSFHGTAFSLLFEKKFYTIPHPTRGSRMIDLLNTVGLSDRIISSLDNEVDSNSQIDYAEANKKLSEMRNDSMCFIDNAIHNHYEDLTDE